MSKQYAIVKGDVIDCIAIADAPLDTDGIWISLENYVPIIDRNGNERYPCPGWTYKDGAFELPPYIEPILLPNIITKVAFRFRLTDAEYVGILTAAKTDVEVAAWVETFNMVSSIDLDNQRTKDGVANLVSKNLLTQARADQILTDPVLSSERP